MEREVTHTRLAATVRIPWIGIAVVVIVLFHHPSNGTVTLEQVRGDQRRMFDFDAKGGDGR